MATTKNGIYYPDNYEEIADVPNDFKKIAESVDEAIDNIPKYDDSDIIKDIDDINDKIDSLEKVDEDQDKAIEQNTTTNTKQDELIKKLKDNSINVTTEEATSLHIEDASTLPAKLEVRGNHYQKTVKGIQILEGTNKGTTNWIFNTSPSNLGVIEEVNFLGTKACKFKLTENPSAWKFLHFKGLNLDKLKNNTTYTIQFDVETNYNENLYIKIQDSSAQNMLVQFGNYNNVNNTKKRFKLVATTNDVVIANQILYIGIDNLGISSDRELIITNLILVEGDYSNTDLEWEEYTDLQGSPSLNYPSDLRAVGDNVNILPNEATSQTEGDLEWTVNQDGSVHVVGTASSNALYLKKGTNNTEEVFRFKANKQYKNAGNVDILYQKTDGGYARKIKGEIFEYEEDELINKLYIQIPSGETVDETYYPKVVEYHEGMDESYSQYEQGATEIKKLNSNIMPISNLGIDWEYTENAIKNLKQNTGTEISVIKIKKGQTIKIRLQLFSKPVASTTFSCLINGVENANMNFSRINEYFNLNQIYERSYTAEEDVTITYKLFGNSENETFEFQLWTNLENAEDYQRYEESIYFLPIQKPMLLGDYFDLENNKEIHKWIERELTGTENITLSDTVDGIAQFTFNEFYDGDYDTGSVNINALSNCYKGVPFQSSWLKDNSISLVGGYTPRIMTSEYSTVEEFKQMLADKYASGNPVKIYYKLIEPKQLDLTEEQKAVLQQLSELDLFKGTNNIITAEALALLQMNYIADTQSYIDSKISNLENQLNTINELLSTSETNAMLLDNLQTDLESEVI